MKHNLITKFMVAVFLGSFFILPLACDTSDPDPVLVVEDPIADPTNASTILEATSSVIADGATTATITLTLADTKGNRYTKSGGTVALMATGEASISEAIDNSDGTYTATITNTKAETVTVSGTLAGKAITATVEVTFNLPPNADQSSEPVGPTLIKINCGGGEITIGDKTFLEDQYFEGSSITFVNEFLTEIEDTELDELFFTERVTTKANPTDPLYYKIPVSNGIYTVKLYLAEVYWGLHPDGIDGGVGSRIFSIKMEDIPILTDIDLYEELGSATADTRMYDIEVTDGELTIFCQSTVDRPKISGIEIFGNGTIN